MSGELDTRTWLMWGVACMLPLLVSRNPWITIELAIVVTVVRAVAVPASAGNRTRWFIRLAAIMALVGAAFNVMTVRAGDIVLLELPASWPVVGGAWTLNALVYGLVGGFTLFVLVLVGMTTAILIRWMDLFQILPKRLAPIAVTGSVAWGFLPQTALAWQNIQETMAMRGHRVRGVKDFLPIVVPLLAGGLERSLTMAEALEARGFGSPANPARRRSAFLSPIALVVGLAGMATAIFLIAVGRTADGGLILMAAILALIVASRLAPVSGPPITSYAERRLTSADLVVMLASLVAIVATLVWVWWMPASLTLVFYPSLTWPDPVPLLLLALSGLLVPALVLHPGPRTQ